MPDLACRGSASLLASNVVDETKNGSARTSPMPCRATFAVSVGVVRLRGPTAALAWPDCCACAARLLRLRGPTAARSEQRNKAES
jgi:hypothetical protein